MARCQTQTDTKPIAICSEILAFLCTHTLPHMQAQLSWNFSSRALPKRCCVSCSKNDCSQTCSSGPELFFWIGRPSIFYSQNRYSLRIHISHMGCGKMPDSDRYKTGSNLWDVARCQIQTDTKPIAICSEILAFLCTHTLPHMHV